MDKNLPQDTVGAVIFRHTRPQKIEPGFPMRNPRQSYEAPVRYPLHEHDKKPAFFNRTMTYRYRSDSDFPIFYSQIMQIHKHPQGRDLERYIEQFGANHKYLAGKRTNLSLSWVVSKCKTHSKREHLVEALKFYVNVAIYGRCGKRIDHSKGISNSQNHHKYERSASIVVYDYMVLLQKYHKFYLSFENSICMNYVTEKFFKVLDHPMIPIVYGGAKYSKIAPRHSFINVFDFQHVRDLADYAIYLHENDAKFAEYFWWKDFYRVDSQQQGEMCGLCKFLYDVNRTTKIYYNLSDRYYGTCKLGLDVTLLEQKGIIQLMQ